MLDHFSPSNRLKDTAPHERPQERLENYGAAALSDTELIAMLLRQGTRGQDVMTLASRLVQEAGSLAAMLAWRESNFRNLRGIGQVKALQLVAVMEIARRALGHPHAKEPMLNHADLVAAYMRSACAGLEVEKFWVLCLNRKGRLLKRVEISSGTATSTLVHPREVYREAIRVAASSVICVHNHPSGDPMPSAQDVAITRTLSSASKIVEIDLLDHVIIGAHEKDPRGLGHYSFRAEGSL